MAARPWKSSANDGPQHARNNGVPQYGAYPPDGPPGAQSAGQHAPGQQPARAPGTDVDVQSVAGIRFVDAAFERAVAVPSAAIHAHVDRLRRRNPHATPAQIIKLLEKQYLMAISTSGGAVGAAAAAPAVGTGVGLVLTGAEVGAFFAASSAFALAVADVHGIGVEETARRRTLLLATVLGEQGANTVGTETGLATTAWAKTLLLNMPTTTIRRVNSVLTRRMLRRQAGRQGALALGRLAPFGIGAVIGATGARALGRTVVSGAERAFGPPPAAFGRTIELAVTGPDDSAPPLRLVEPRNPPEADGDPGTPPWPTPR